MYKKISLSRESASEMRERMTTMMTIYIYLCSYLYICINSCIRIVVVLFVCSVTIHMRYQKLGKRFIIAAKRTTLARLSLLEHRVTYTYIGYTICSRAIQK